MSRINRIWIVAAVCVALTITQSANADFGDQLFKLLPKDGAASDFFGGVAISGDIAIVGAVRHDDNGTDSGSAYLFDITTGEQIAKLLPDDGAADDHFGGTSVAISGAIAIVGAYRDDDNGIDSGSAYLFDTTTGQQIAKLLADDGAADDQFSSVGISGATAIVGARYDDDNGADSGSAYLFDISDPANPTQLFKLLPNDGAAADQFGSSVAISGTTAIVGARYDDDNGSNSGSAYLFDATPGQQLFKLLPDDGAGNDYFGDVAISGDIAIVGAALDDDNGTESGSAYLFDITTGEQIAKLLPDDGQVGDNFGYSVAISGATAIVGAQFDGDDGAFSGSAYLFETTRGRQIAKLLADDGAPFDQFGASVAISGAIAIVGAYLDDDNGIDSGSAYLFDVAGVAPCPWDLDGDDVVGTGDLIVLLGSWGDPYGTADLIELLGTWGPCPK